MREWYTLYIHPGMVGGVPLYIHPSMVGGVSFLVYTLLYTPGYTTLYTPELRTVSAVQGVVQCGVEGVLGSNLGITVGREPSSLPGPQECETRREASAHCYSALPVNNG